MQSHFGKMNLKTVFCITLALLLGAGTALAQQQVNLTAGGTSLTLPGPSPQHISQPPSWPISNSGAEFNPPPQGPRVQSFSTEVAVGTPASLTWKAPRPGTYLLESGTHPSIQGPMGLYGIVVVTQ